MRAHKRPDKALAWLKAYETKWDALFKALTPKEQQRIEAEPEGRHCVQLSVAAYNYANQTTAARRAG